MHSSAAESNDSAPAQGIAASPSQQHERPLSPDTSTSPRTPMEEKLFARIATDLEPWRNGITREMVEHTYCTVIYSALPCKICKSAAITCLPLCAAFHTTKNIKIS